MCKILSKQKLGSLEATQFLKQKYFILLKLSSDNSLNNSSTQKRIAETLLHEWGLCAAALRPVFIVCHK